MCIHVIREIQNKERIPQIACRDTLPSVTDHGELIIIFTIILRESCTWSRASTTSAIGRREGNSAIERREGNSAIRKREGNSAIVISVNRHVYNTE